MQKQHLKLRNFIDFSQLLFYIQSWEWVIPTPVVLGRKVQLFAFKYPFRCSIFRLSIHQPTHLDVQAFEFFRSRRFEPPPRLAFAPIPPVPHTPNVSKLSVEILFDFDSSSYYISIHIHPSVRLAGCVYVEPPEPF